MEFPLVRRNVEFPFGAKDVLRQLDKAGSRVLKNADRCFLRDLQSAIDEHVFCMVDMKGTFTRRLNNLQELQLLDLLVDFFDCCATGNAGHLSAVDSSGGPVKSSSYAFFQLLFCGQAERDRSLHDARMNVLVKLISLAIEVECVPLLNHASTWILRHLQQKQPTNHMLAVAEQLLEHYCDNDPHLAACLSRTISLSPNFPVVLLPLMFDKYEIGSSPPIQTFDVIANWLSTNQKIFVRNLRDPSKNANFLKLFAHSFARLLCLDIVRPLDSHNRPNREQKRFFSTLHFNLLQLILLCSKSNVEPMKFLPARIVNFCLNAIDKFSVENPHELEPVREAVDRLTQLIQMCGYGNFLGGLNRKDLDPALINKLSNFHLLQFVFTRWF